MVSILTPASRSKYGLTVEDPAMTVGLWVTVNLSERPLRNGRTAEADDRDDAVTSYYELATHQSGKRGRRDHWDTVLGRLRGESGNDQSAFLGSSDGASRRIRFDLGGVDDVRETLQSVMRSAAILAAPAPSSATLTGNPEAIYVFASDASGPDGVGGFEGHLDEKNPRFFSEQWFEGRGSGASTTDELMALHKFVQRQLALPNDQRPNPLLLVWVTDSESGAYAVNCGRAHAYGTRNVLLDVLEGLDELGWAVVALWHPRGLHEFADFLSHVAALCNSQEVTGRCSDFERGGALAGISDKAVRAASVSVVDTDTVLTPGP